jgi:integrase
MAWSARDKRPLRKTFATVSEARQWRAKAQIEVREARLGAPSQRTLRQASDEWLQGARTGQVRTRSHEPFKPSALRGYHQVLGRHVLPRLGHLRLSSITHVALQDLVDGMLADGLSASTAANAMLPVRAILGRAVKRSELPTNPTLGLSIPPSRGTRDRVARPEEASALIGALEGGDRALWATALYAGLRRGELQALVWQDIDVHAGLIRVGRSWDRVAGHVAPKSRAGRRNVPIPRALRTQLAAHRLGQDADLEFVFPSSAGRPFDPPTVARRAGRAWTAAALRSITLHECRHTYAAFMIAAGVNAKALSTYMGHASITVTLDRYGHLMPGNENQAAGLLDTYLAVG